MERELARVATRAHGVATRRELLKAGISPSEVEHRLQTGLLLPVHRGVYRVGHRAPTEEARYLAAVKACGDGAVLSGLAAAHLLGLVRTAPRYPDVTAPTERRVTGVSTRRSPSACASDATVWRGIPVTSVPRTLVDIAARLDRDELARACHEAEVKHGTTPAHVDVVLARCPRARGAGELRRILHGDVRVTLSRLEARFLRLLQAERLSLPETNRVAGGRRVDCRWPALNLTIELDGYRYHHSRHAWEQDRRREREARARGDEFRRYTYGDVCEEPGLMLAELRALLPVHGPG